MIDMSECKSNCDNISEYIKSQQFDYDKELENEIKNCPSKLDTLDLLFSLTMGILAAVLQTNDKIKNFLNEVHETSNSENPSSDNPIIDFLAKVFKHNKDWIDQVPVDKEGHVKFVNRAAEEIADGVWNGVGGAPHRIYWGHDIFSFNQDNPFFLEIRQYGFFKGILQAVRHLLADTCSRQGLPIPTSSWWDSPPDEDGKISNRLLEFCQKYAKEALGKGEPGANNEVFNSVFSIHMQDVVASGLVLASIKAYSLCGNIKDEERLNQMKIVAFGCSFLGGAIIGYVKTSIPEINWQSILGIFKAEICLCKASNNSIQKLSIKTQAIIEEGKGLRERHDLIHKEVLLYAQKVVSASSDNENDLIAFFERG